MGCLSAGGVEEAMPVPWAKFNSEEFLQSFGGHIRVTENTLEDFGVKSFGGVKRDCGTLAGGILINHVAAALPGKGKSRLFQYGNDLTSR
jgi:hypothetical protein